jgi:cytochrome c biogenesis protein CcdA
VSYTLLAWLLMALLRGGASAFGVQRFFALWGERMIGPIMLLVGIVLLLGERLRLPAISLWKQRQESPTAFGAFLMGCAFALAFCPTSGILYFGGLLPLALSTTAGWLLPLLFAFATAVPVVLVSIVLAYSMQNIGRVMGKIQSLQRILNLLVAVLFIGIGGYYIIIQLL